MQFIEFKAYLKVFLQTNLPLIFGVCKSVLSIIMANARVIIESGDLSFVTFIPQLAWPRLVPYFLELQL